MRAATVVQQLCKSCKTCFMFYCMFYFTCDPSLKESNIFDASLTQHLHDRFPGRRGGAAEDGVRGGAGSERTSATAQRPWTFQRPRDRTAS